MNEQNSYGTGRAPEKKPSHLPIILLLLAIFAATQLIAHSHDSSESSPAPTKKNDALLLPEQASSDETALLPDGCGLGLTLGDLSEPQRKYWSLPSGVYIEEIDESSAAHAAGLRAGDVIVQVGASKVHDAQSCMQALQKQTRSDVLTLHYYREGKEYRAEIPLHP